MEFWFDSVVRGYHVYQSVYVITMDNDNYNICEYTVVQSLLLEDAIRERSSLVKNQNVHALTIQTYPWPATISLTRPMTTVNSY